MSEETPMGQDEIRKLRPGVQFRDQGCLDPSGQPRDDLAGNFATAACIAFEEAELSPQELSTVYEAIKQCLELADASDPVQQLRQAVEESYDLTSGLLGKKINGAIVDWVREWLPFVEDENGVAAFMQHMSSVTQQYALIMTIKQGA